MIEAPAKKFRLFAERAETPTRIRIVVGYLLLGFAIYAIEFVIALFVVPFGDLTITPTFVARLVTMLLAAVGYYWTARQIENRRKRGGYVLIAVIIVGALPLLSGQIDLMHVVMTVLG